MIDTKNEGMVYNPDIMKALSIKKLLTLDEAAYYSGIGSKTIRTLVHRNPIPKFVLFNGVKILIKRSLFEKWIDDPNLKNLFEEEKNNE